MKPSATAVALHRLSAYKIDYSSCVELKLPKLTPERIISAVKIDRRTSVMSAAFACLVLDPKLFQLADLSLLTDLVRADRLGSDVASLLFASKGGQMKDDLAILIATGKIDVSSKTKLSAVRYLYESLPSTREPLEISLDFVR